MKRLACAFVTLVTLTLTAPATADYQAGADAYQSGDFRKAMAEWLPLAEGGDAVAQNSVGALYDHGLGVDEDDAEAARWYQMAADQNLPLAMRNLGGMYAGGYGVPFDKAQAEFWYEKAAGLGDQVAMKRLAVLNPSYIAPAEPATPAPAPESMTVAGADDAAVEAESTGPITEAPTATVLEPDVAPAEALALAEAPADGADGLQYGEGAVSAANEPALQQASVAPPAPVAGNWLIGAWEGPSLGCPPGGGLEFGAGETRSYFGGRIAATLAAAYQADGDLITVVSTGVDGVGQTYQYRRTAADRFVIAAVPAEMPASIVGVEYRRCGSAPAQTADAAAPAVVPEPAPEPQAKPFQPIAAETEPPAAITPAAEPATEPLSVPTQPTEILPAQPEIAAAAPAGGTAQDGWDAFGRGDYQGALAVWTPLAEGGDPNMQILVGSIYDFGQGVPQDDAEAAKWYQMAAERGSAKAQYQLGALYTRSAQVREPAQGYKWLTIAAKSIGGGNASGITADQATTLRALAAMSMSEAEIAEAEAAAKAFAAKP